MSIRVGFGAVGLKGGNPGKLDHIDPDTFKNNDICIVLDGNQILFYFMNQYSNAFEYVPYIIKPDRIRPDHPIASKMKRWHLVSQETYDTHLIQSLDNYIQTKLIKAIDNNDIVIDFFDNNNMTINQNGIVVFDSQVAGVYPQTPTEFTINQYLQDVLSLLQTTLENYIGDINITPTINEWKNLKIIWVDDYINDNEYVENGINTLHDNVTIYADAEIQAFVDSIDLQYHIHEYTLNSWSTFDTIYVSTITHNLGKQKFYIDFFIGNEKIVPTDVGIIDDNNIMVWNWTNETMTVYLFEISE